MNEVQVSAGYERSKSDTSFYVQKRTVAGRDVFAACAVFVDDILVTGDDTEKLDELKDLFIEKSSRATHTSGSLSIRSLGWTSHTPVASLL